MIEEIPGLERVPEAGFSIQGLRLTSVQWTCEVESKLVTMAVQVKSSQVMSISPLPPACKPI
jgi:hypothetical protein